MARRGEGAKIDAARGAETALELESARALWRMMAPAMWRHKLQLGAAVALLVSAKVATVSVPLVLKALVDALDVSSGPALALPVGLLLGYGGLRLGSALSQELRNVVFVRTRYQIMQEMALQVVSHLHALSLRYHLERKTGAISRDINRGTRSMSDVLSYVLFNIVPTILEITMVTAILIASYSGSFALVALVTFVVYLTFTLRFTAWRIQFRKEVNQAESVANTQAIDALLNYETVKYSGNETFELDRYQRSMQVWQDAAVKSETTRSALNAGQSLIITAGVTALMFLAADGVVEGDLSLGDLVAVNAFLLQLFLPLGFLGSIYGFIRNALTDMERMVAMLNLAPEIQDAPDAQTLQVGAGEVRFEDVTFAYDPERPILKGLSFTIAPGTKTALVGPSGAGKSTLARLLFRFYDVTGGRVCVDGQDVREVTQASLREALGVVPQDTVLFNDTLGYNIRYGRLSATDEEVERAAQMASLSAFIERLPLGYETVVGERGLKLSGGEKQRVAIARALLKAPRIMIFDEATSSLDSASEQAILGAMRDAASRQTSLVIAHRLSTVVDADQILVLEDGQITERGTHLELLMQGGAYARLWRMQRQDDEDQAAEP